MTKINPNLTILPTSSWMWAVNVGLLLIVVATALPLFHIGGHIYRYVYSVGALAVLVGRLFMPRYKGASLRIRRLCRMEAWSGILFCAGAFFMWYVVFASGVGRMDWIAFTLAGAVLQIYTSVMIPRVAAKERDIN